MGNASFRIPFFYGKSFLWNSLSFNKSNRTKILDLHSIVKKLARSILVLGKSILSSSYLLWKSEPPLNNTTPKDLKVTENL